MNRWQLQEAMTRLSELVRSAEQEGPQEIAAHGEAAVVVMSRAAYDRLRRDKPSFVDFLRRSPLVGTDLKVKRDRTPARRVRL